jgi:hypothetical protein
LLFTALFWDRLAELEYQQKVLNGLIDRNNDNPDVQIKAVHELHSITTNMAQLFINLPAARTLSIPIPSDSTCTMIASIRKQGKDTPQFKE